MVHDAQLELGTIGFRYKQAGMLMFRAVAIGRTLLLRWSGMMRRHLIAIVTGCPLNLVGTNANGATRRAHRGVEDGYDKDDGDHSRPTGIRSHHFSKVPLRLPR
jgi:hypothetical protein